MISVVIPTYNRSKTISRAIDSVLNQTYKDFEIIIVDDGSSDDTFGVISKYKDKRIKYYKKENGGAASARNYGIRKANGEYIAFQDSDDEWRPSKLEIQLRATVENNADVVVCRFDRHNYKIKNGRSSVLPRINAGFVPYEKVVEECVVSTQTVFAKTNVLKDICFDETLRKLEDYEWSIRVASSYKLYLCDEVLVDVYLQNDSITHNGADLHFIEEIYKRNTELLKQHPKANGYMLNYVGNHRETIGEKGYLYYGKAFLATANPKYLVKAAFSITGVLGYLKSRSND